MSSIPQMSGASFFRRNLTFIAPALVFVAFYGIGGVLYRNFFSLRVFLDLFTDNSFLGLAAVGMTVVIISGGIDLSVGSVVSTTAMIIAFLTARGVPPVATIAIALSFGTLLGLGMGAIIQYFEAPPFIVTLAGMFLARGIGYVLSLSSIPISHPLFTMLSQAGVRFSGRAKLTVLAMLFLGMVLITAFLLRQTKFGRTVFAMGGNEQSAFLMGLPVARTKILIYTFSGFCAGVGGIALALYTLAGYGQAGLGLELNAIASVVIGGSLLTGGYGSVFGTVVGVSIQGLIQTLITFQGTLNVYWTRIFIGTLLFVFIVLQRVFVVGAGKGKK
jgi:galactofuranose transport system permease protein